MRNPGSYLTTTAEDKRFRRITFHGVEFEDGAEVDCFGCQHCNRIVAVKPFCDAADAGGLCKNCMGLICPQCYDVGVCIPLEKRMKEEEDRHRFVRSMQEWG